MSRADAQSMYVTCAASKTSRRGLPGGREPGSR